MRFTIITNKPGHQPPQSSCDFLPPGGTIGRGVDNNLVLPDNDRTISRLQAIVHITADGECRITNRGNVTRVELNDIPLERGRQVELQDGDILGIDEYRLLVNDLNVSAQPTVQKAAPVTRPVAPVQTVQSNDSTAAIPSEIWDSLAKEFSISDSISTSQMKPAASHNPLTAPTTENRNPEDPLAQFKTTEPLNLDRRSQAPDALFNHDELFKSESIFNDGTPTTLVQPAADKKVQPQTQRDELDPLALFGGKPTPAQRNSDDPLGLMMGGAVPLVHPDDETNQQRPEPVAPEPRSSAADKSDLFGSADDLARSPLFNDDLQPRTSEKATDDTASPFVDVRAGAQATDDALKASPLFADNAPQAGEQDADFNDALKAASPSGAESSPRSDTHTEDALKASPLFADLSADKPGSIEASPLFNQTPPRAETPDYGGITLPTPQTVQRSVTPPPKGRLRIDPVASSSQQQTPSSDGEALQGELLQALLDGMGLNDMQPTPHFDRENMQQLGQMLGMFSQGTVALLSSRSILKRGVKADMTVILDDANNPFKLLPSGKTVLMQMFGSRMPGFMPPKQAVRDALVDLQAHQLGMIAGIRAIIAAMLQSFNPQQLEEEARQEGVTSRLSLPGSRKAALWEHFNRRYNETAGEIEDDFHTLFGEAFLHAYDMEVNQYKDSQTASEE
ncbi:type VI secretion system-associated FHA domain protein TagH [Mixta sp. Marseille-Q2659]|uniref:type VI secretion system-associated FHA domain protein TagH n=1 Tax=Mixta sp. Marseille-Q2659 TaxID=2736607 RepID=UPI0023B89237|nr:type VI secretion system-associated FHA domain protein TagH [Mixta sp. Marseille-Q2659]